MIKPIINTSRACLVAAMLAAAGFLASEQAFAANPDTQIFAGSVTESSYGAGVDASADGGVTISPAEKHIDARAIHPRYREWPVPVEGEVVRQNPPSFLWPASKAKTDIYRVKLSKNWNFPESSTSYGPWTEWTVYSPHKTLANGKWFWQIETKTEAGEVTASPVMSFTVEAGAHNFPTPSPDELSKLISSTNHHRLYVTQDDLIDFRTRNADNPEAEVILKRAKKNLSMDLIPEAPTRPRDTTGKSDFEKQVLMRFMYHQFGDKVKGPIVDFCLAYLLTGERPYADAAIKHAMHVAAMSVDGWATQEDFNRASIMLALATAYDTTYDLLTEEQREKILRSIAVRGEYFFDHYCKKFETHSMDNHVWQHTLKRFLFTAIATAGDLPDADKWLRYCYEVWCCRFPILGGEDGGWHDGSSYFAVNFETFIMIPFTFSRLTGTDFFNLPWYDNLPRFLIYSYPKNSYSTGFGDGMEKMDNPSTAYMGFADALARETASAEARWYADKLIGKKADNLYKDKKFSLYRLLTDKKIDSVEPKAPKRNTSAFFPDAGFSIMHTNPAKSSEDLMAVFMGLPFGSTGHAHAAHNGFTINYGGKQLFGATGHYSNFNDAHTMMHYRTRGHNTILADGLSPVIGENGYGWLPRFADTPALTYTLGDATHAFDSMRTPFWIDRMEKSEIEYTAENGFGDPGIKRYRRHFIFLKPDIIVIYDELEAEKPVEWTWLLRSYNLLTPASPVVNDKKSKLHYSAVRADNGAARGTVILFATDEIIPDISNEFFSPAVNWKERTGSDGKPLVYEKHWHTDFTAAGKTEGRRFLCIIKIEPTQNAGTGAKTEKLPQVTVKDNGDGASSVSIEGWTINASMDASQQPRLEISDSKGNKVLYNTPESAICGSTLIHSANGTVTELEDVIPVSVRIPKN